MRRGKKGQGKMCQSQTGERTEKRKEKKEEKSFFGICLSFVYSDELARAMTVTALVHVMYTMAGTMCEKKWKSHENR